jgi:organic hydroperoxide reductase OsmC/OhrA
MPDKVLYTAEVISTAAHQRCPYSQATRGNISVELRVP